MIRPPRAAALTAILLCAAIWLAGCGQGSAPGSPTVAGVPLPAHARLFSEVRRCDGGAHPFCARELVLVAPRTRYPNSNALLTAEAARLRHAGWSSSNGATDQETASEPPSHHLRLAYATAADDLRSVDQGRITRATPIARALSAQMFARAPALSLMLQAGSS